MVGISIQRFLMDRFADDELVLNEPGATGATGALTGVPAIVAWYLATSHAVGLGALLWLVLTGVRP